MIKNDFYGYDSTIKPLLTKTFDGAKTTNIISSQLTNIFTVIVKDNIKKEQIKLLSEELIKNQNYTNLETQNDEIFSTPEFSKNKSFAFGIIYFVPGAKDCGDRLDFYTDNTNNKTIFIRASSIGCSRDN